MPSVSKVLSSYSCQTIISQIINSKYAEELSYIIDYASHNIESFACEEIVLNLIKDNDIQKLKIVFDYIFNYIEDEGLKRLIYEIIKANNKSILKLIIKQMRYNVRFDVFEEHIIYLIQRNNTKTLSLLLKTIDNEITYQELKKLLFLSHNIKIIRLLLEHFNDFFNIIDLEKMLLSAVKRKNFFVTKVILKYYVNELDVHYLKRVFSDSKDLSHIILQANSLNCMEIVKCFSEIYCQDFSLKSIYEYARDALNEKNKNLYCVLIDMIFNKYNLLAFEDMIALKELPNVIFALNDLKSQVLVKEFVKIYFKNLN